MTIQEMHYDFKSKLNKVDSSQFINLRIPEIDWCLNEAQEVFIKGIAFPRHKDQLGFEYDTRSIEDVKNIVINNVIINATLFSPGDQSYFITLPIDYKYYLASWVNIKKGECKKKVRGRVIQHDDVHANTLFHKSSFEWEDVNIRFFTKGIRVFTDETFEVESLCLDYLREPRYMHFAEGTAAGSYKTPHNITLVGLQNCELDDSSHREIVNIAVDLVTNNILKPNYQTKKPQIFDNI